MKSIYDVRRANLAALIASDFDGKQVAFADAMGYDPSMVSRLLSTNPAVRQNIGSKMARAIEPRVGKPPNWMDTPANADEPPSPGYNVEPGPGVRGSVPVISWVQAGRWSEIVDNLGPGDAERWIFTTVKVGPRAFALRVVGNSMTNPVGAPSFPEGHIVIVDPDRQADPGRFVIVRQNHDGESTFKQLIRDGGRLYLKPLNPQYPLLELEPDATICGVIVQAIVEV